MYDIYTVKTTQPHGFCSIWAGLTVATDVVQFSRNIKLEEILDTACIRALDYCDYSDYYQQPEHPQGVHELDYWLGRALQWRSIPFLFFFCDRVTKRVFLGWCGSGLWRGIWVFGVAPPCPNTTTVLDLPSTLRCATSSRSSALLFASPPPRCLTCHSPLWPGTPLPTP